MQQAESLTDAVLEPSELALLLARIGASRHFRRTSRLRSFLEFVCEETLAGRAHLINEQTVGNRVFARPSEYDPSSDNIVRVEARELRKRLEAYFSEEGAQEPIVIRIPKGGYAVAFETRVAEEAPAPVEAKEPVVAPPPRIDGNRAIIGALVLAVAALSLLSAYLYRANAQKQASTPASLSAAFWSKVFDPKRPTLIALPDSNFSLLQDLRVESVPAAEYTSGRYLARLKEQVNGDDSARIQAWIAARHYTGLGDVAAMMRLIMHNRSLSPLVVRSAREVSIRDLKSQNIILFGSSRSNPWVDFLQKDARFLIGYDTKLRRPLLQDQKPATGKPSTYVGGLLGEKAYDAYGLVSVTANLDGNGYALSIAGTNTQGTEAAGEFLADANRLEEFLRQIGWNEQQPIPYFEVALKVVAVGGSSVSSQVLGYHRPSANK